MFRLSNFHCNQKSWNVKMYVERSSGVNIWMIWIKKVQLIPMLWKCLIAYHDHWKHIFCLSSRNKFGLWCYHSIGWLIDRRENSTLREVKDTDVETVNSCFKHIFKHHGILDNFYQTGILRFLLPFGRAQWKEVKSSSRCQRGDIHWQKAGLGSTMGWLKFICGVIVNVIRTAGINSFLWKSLHITLPYQIILEWHR